MRYQDNELRHELKYFMSEAAYYDLRTQFKRLLIPDQNMEDEQGYWIRSMYFDDYQNSCANDKEDGVRLRNKYRVRIYNGSDERIKLEKKAKFDNYISKGSATLSREEYGRILEGDYSFLALKKQPGVYGSFLCAQDPAHASYDYCGVFTGSVFFCRKGMCASRLTNICMPVCTALICFDPNLILTSVLPQHLMIMEVKYDDFLPAVVKRVLKGHPKDHCAISKFLLCSKELRKVKLYV